MQSALPPVIKRHELKYAIPRPYVEPISRFIAPYCDLDHHSAISSDHFYLVNSLYFDTRGLEFLQQRMFGKDGRFNVRVRSYGDRGEAPYFLEIKRKSGFIGVKNRSVATAEEWPNILTDASYQIPRTGTAKERANKNLFYRIALSYAIEPKLLTQYRRRAFISTVDEYARVTMDANMRYRKQNHYDLTPGSDMVNYDNETIYTKDYTRDTSVILDLKSNVGEVPTWMLDLISTFDLQQQGFSKYMNSALVSHFDDGIGYMSSDRKARYYAGD